MLKKGQYKMTEKHKRHIAMSNLGGKRTIEQRKRMSKNMKGIKKIVHHDKQFKKGQPSWIKGRHHTLETRKKMSIARKGLTGEKSHNWKGGITQKDKLLRKKFQREIQKIVFERDNYTCQLCGVRGSDMQVDHIQSWSEYVDLRFKLDNCRTLCAKCHYQITFGKPMPESVRGWGHNLLKGSVKI